MRETTADLLRCPFCGTRLSLVENQALVRLDDGIESGVLGCECCAFPVVAGIPVMTADDTAREAIRALEAGQPEAALFTLLGLDGPRAGAFRALCARGDRVTYRDALAILCQDAEDPYFVYRFSDPTYVTAEAVLQAIGRRPRTMDVRALDLCGGSGHLARVLADLGPRGGTVLADVFFWKVWLAARYTAPGCEPVCCDANAPLPFVRDAFSLVLLADAFPYIWHKRLLAGEMIRLAGPDGTIVMPHLHSSLGENVSPGDTLTPAAYRDLFDAARPRLFSDERLLTDVLDRRVVDLTCDVSPVELGAEPSFTLVASRHEDLFERHELPDPRDVSGELRVNPLYRVERRGGSSILTLTFPTPEYEEEFGACRRYLPDTVTVSADVTGAIVPAMLGPEYDALRRRRILIDAPPRYY